MSESLEAAIAALEEYLKRYPSGHFAELAQGRLDRLLAERGERRIAIASSEGNPFSAGTFAADPNYRVGDQYRTHVIDGYTGVARPGTLAITAVTLLEVAYNDGLFITDFLGNPTKLADGKRIIDNQVHPAEYFVGKRWTSRYTFTTAYGTDTTTVDFAIKAREIVEVPAGRFQAFRVEGSGWSGRGNQIRYRYWAAPERVRRDLVFERRFSDPRGIAFTHERTELVSFQEAVAPARTMM